MTRSSVLVLFTLAFPHLVSHAKPPEPTLDAPQRTVDLNVGESETVTLADGKKVTVKVLDLRETKDSLRGAVRKAEMDVEVNGKKGTLVSANYRLPTTIGGVQIDCPVTKGYRENSSQTVGGRDVWGLVKEVRLRLWPVGSPLINPGTFVYPAKQRWFASGTQMANEPVHVDGGEIPLNKRIYYHYGLDMGGAEGMVEVVAATDGLVVSSGKEVLDGYKDTPVAPRYDVVYLLDARGWFYRYSHLHSISPEMKPGKTVKMGQLVGILGKEGGSGGWSHLHFDISGRQPSGKWGIVEGYAFLWEAYLKQYKPELIAVARPHHFVATGEKVLLDGSRSWSSSGTIDSYDWTFNDGKTSKGATVERIYEKPGVYSEVLKITDGKGRSDYDFAVVNVVDAKKPEQLPPSIHAVYYPTMGIKPGENVTFMVRTFRTTDGKETWDFGDGSAKVTVQSDGNVVQLAKDGYARTVHRYEKAGHYLVRVERTNGRGFTAVAHLQVRVGEGSRKMPYIIAHRGSSIDCPENSLAGVRRAIEVGADATEIDARTTKDGVLVCSHDEDLSRTTDGKGTVGELTLAEIKRLDAGSKFDAKFKGERIPTVAEVLALSKGRIDVMIDLKETSEEYVEKIAAVVRKEGDEARTLLGVRSVEQAKRLRKLLPKARQIGLVPTIMHIESFTAAGVETIRLWPKWLDDTTLVPNVRKLGVGLLIGAGTVKEEEIRPLLPYEPEMMSSDDPQRLRKAMAEWTKARP